MTSFATSSSNQASLWTSTTRSRITSTLPRSMFLSEAHRAAMCAALKRPDAREQVDRILRKQGAGLQAPDRHRELAEALGMPVFSVGFDYGALQNGELPEGLDEFDVIFTATEPG
jgi:hypothetical protein